MAASSAFSGLGYRSAAGAHGGQMLLWKLSCHLLLCWFVQKWRTLFRNDPKWQCLVSIFFHIFPTGKWGYTMGFEGYLFPKLTDCSRSWDLGEHPEPISIPVLKVDNPHTDHLRKQKDIIQRSTSPVFLDTISSKTLATIRLRFLGLQIDSPNVLPENNCWSRGDVMHCRHLNL